MVVWRKDYRCLRFKWDDVCIRVHHRAVIREVRGSKKCRGAYRRVSTGVVPSADETSEQIQAPQGRYDNVKKSLTTPLQQTLIGCQSAIITHLNN